MTPQDSKCRNRKIAKRKASEIAMMYHNDPFYYNQPSLPKDAGNRLIGRALAHLYPEHWDKDGNRIIRAPVAPALRKYY